MTVKFITVKGSALANALGVAAKINWREWLENSGDDDSFPGKRYWY